MQIYIYGMDIFVQNWYDLLIIWPSNNNETTWSLIKYLDEKKSKQTRHPQNET